MICQLKTTTATTFDNSNGGKSIAIRLAKGRQWDMARSELLRWKLDEIDRRWCNTVEENFVYWVFGDETSSLWTKTDQFRVFGQLSERESVQHGGWMMAREQNYQSGTLLTSMRIIFYFMKWALWFRMYLMFFNYTCGEKAIYSCFAFFLLFLSKN